MGTGWQKPIGCTKLQVIFCKRATNYRALLRKMSCKDKAFYGSSPHCIVIWDGYDYQAPYNYRSLLQKSPIKERIFCKRPVAYVIEGCRVNMCVFSFTYIYSYVSICVCI